ncbi:MAG: molecular chaperone TorD family protein [Deltaproteobacteria bacterium]|nr:MAG: molecular chaperone TorD family protein [Deltaproteobacteria bacterium]
METDELLSRELARGEAYKLLAECYYLPTPELKIKLTDLEQQMTNVCPEAMLYVKKMSEEIERSDDLDILSLDFSRLFLGPYKMHAPPYGSVYLDGERQIMAESTLEVRKIYRESGLDISSDFRNPPDHVAAELEFMHFLIFNKIQALENSEVDTAFDYLEKQRAFLTEHLGAWVFDFADSIEEKAETDFYKNLARATRAFIAEYLDELSDLSETEAHGHPCMSVANE